MALRNLILGRLRRTGAIAAPAASARVGTTVAPDLAKTAGSEPEEPLAANPLPADPDPTVERPTKAHSKVVADRVTTSVISGELPPGDRCYAALDRLGLVHDAAEVRLTADDGVAGFVVAARQIIFARFVMQDGFEESFDFRPEPLSIDLAVRFCRVFVAYCARPLDLEVEERSFAGVFAAEVGLAIADISFDEDVFRALLAERAAHPERQPHNEGAAAENQVPAAADVSDSDVPPATEATEVALTPEAEQPHPIAARRKERRVQSEASSATARAAPDGTPDSVPAPDPAAAPALTLNIRVEAEPTPAAVEALPATPALVEATPGASPAKTATPAARPVSESDFPFAFLAQCRGQADDVLRHTRAGDAALLAGGKATDLPGEGLGNPALRNWQQKLAPVLGPKLVVVLVPAAAQDRLTVIALDDESATAFRAPRPALGGLCQTARKALSGQG